MSLPVTGQQIAAEECLGDSLVKINNNTERFQNGINALNTGLSGVNTTINNLNTTVLGLSTSIIQAEFTVPGSGVTTYTVVASDIGRTIRMNASTVNQVRLPNTLNTGFTVSVLQEGLGRTEFVATGTGTVLRHPDNFFRLYKQWSLATAVYIGTNTWVLLGDLTA